MTRRHFALALSASALAASAAPAKTPVCAFSKHFQWLSVADAATLAASIGYDALDLTVRRGGHIEPARVAADLPTAVEQVRAAGLAVPMVTTDIVDTATPHAETVIRTLAALGIRRYRWGGFRYDYSQPLPPQLEEAKRRARDLAALNHHYGVCAMYHTHSGRNQLGASMWDIWYVLKDLDTTAVGVNLDSGHVTVEGGLGGWINSTLLLAPMVRGIAVKDFYWQKTPQGWAPRWCGLGDGMVDFTGFLKILKQAGFEGPVQLHMEYEELGAAHTGKTTSTIPKEEFVRLCRRDLERLRRFQSAAGF
jgi:sugar phosphate isomerase/epimerase